MRSVFMRRLREPWRHAESSCDSTMINKAMLWERWPHPLSRHAWRTRWKSYAPQRLSSPCSPCFPEFAPAVRYGVPGTPSGTPSGLPSALERPHVVEELVIEMEVRELRVGQGNGGALDQDRDNLGRSRVVSPLSSQGVLDLFGNPLRLLGRRGPEEHENIALVNVLVELALPALAGLQVQKVLKETHVQTLEHLNSLHHLVQVFHGIGYECLLVTACLVTQRLRLELLTSASDERRRPRGGFPGRRKGR